MSFHVPHPVAQHAARKEERKQALQQRIRECQHHQQTLSTNIGIIKRAGFQKGIPSEEIERQVVAQLGGKSEEEWLLLYDMLIREAKDELVALDEAVSLADHEQLKQSLIVACAATGLFFIVLIIFLIPQPLAVLTGNVVGETEVSVDAASLLATLVVSLVVGVAVFFTYRRNY